MTGRSPAGTVGTWGTPFSSVRVSRTSPVNKRRGEGASVRGEVFHQCFFYRSIALLPPAGGWEGGQRGQSVPPSPRAPGFPPSSPPPAGGREASPTMFLETSQAKNLPL